MSPGRSLLCVCLLLFLHLMFMCPLYTRAQDEAPVFLSWYKTDYFTKPSHLKLECVAESGANISFWRRLRGELQLINDNGNDSLEFDVTPDLEGEYFCQADGVDSHSINVLAYPLYSVAVEASYMAYLGSETILPCVFTPGAFRERYSVKWFKGLTRVDTSDPRFSIRANDFSLVIKNVNAFDTGSAYYCAVDVDSGELSSSVHRKGPSLELIVTGSLSILQPPVGVVTSPGTQQPAMTFSCSAYGLPRPVIYWLHEGKKVTVAESEVLSLADEGSDGIITVTSHLSFTSLKQSESGRVQCVVATQAGDTDNILLLSSSADLIVLPDSFRPELRQTSAGIELSFSLPTSLPSVFSLVLYYYDSEGSLIRKTELVDTAFSNTRDVKYLMKEDDLPHVLSFFVRVAIKVNNVEGALSDFSQLMRIDPQMMPSSRVDSECDCSESASTDSSLQTGLIVFIALLLVFLSVAVGVAIWAVAIMMKQKKLHDASFDNGYEDKHCGSRSRSVSRDSSSRSTSRSSSRSSHTSTHSHSHTHTRSRSHSCSSYSSHHSSGRLTHRSDSVSVRSVLSGRGDPEGNYSEDDYTIVNSSKSGRDSAKFSSRHTTCKSIPLPSMPYVEGKTHPNTTTNVHSTATENPYEEVDFKKSGDKHNVKIVQAHLETQDSLDCHTEPGTDV